MKNKIKNKLIEISNTTSQIVNQKTIRERVLILITGAVISLMIITEILLKPAIKSQSDIINKSQAIKQQNLSLDEQLKILHNGLNVDVLSDKKEEKNKLLLDQESLSNKLSLLTSNLIPPDKMSDVLHQALTEISGLKLIKVESLKSEALFLATNLEKNDKSNQEAKLDKPSLYKHGFRLTFNGQFFNILKYITKLESTNFKLLWGHFLYKVTKYPDAEITIDVHTLSDKEDLIGV